MKLTSIILVNYNSGEHTVKCIHSILKYHPNHSLEIIVVDNNSMDNSVVNIRNLFPNIKIIENSTNVGFGRANNIGVQHASGFYILILNNDTLMSENVIDPVLLASDKLGGKGILGCKLMYQSGKTQLSTFKFPKVYKQALEPLGTTFLVNKMKFKYQESQKKAMNQVDWISGAFMFMKKEVYSELEGFSNNIFMYGEDIDLCIRAKMLKIPIYYMPNVQVIHLEGGSIKSIERTILLADSGRLAYFKLNGGRFSCEIIRFSFMIRSIIRLNIFYSLFVVTKKNYWHAHAHAHLMGIINLIKWNYESNTH